MSTKNVYMGCFIGTPCLGRPCYQILTVEMTPNQLMKANIEALLKIRGKEREDLAKWCHNTKNWVDKVFREDRRTFPITYYTTIAKQLGVEVYQLLQPGGITPHIERRSGSDRRKRIDRRVSDAVISEKALDVDVIHVVRAISLEGRRQAIKVLMDILNDELRDFRRPPTSGGDGGAQGHNGGTPRATRARKPKA